MTQEKLKQTYMVDGHSMTVGLTEDKEIKVINMPLASDFHAHLRSNNLMEAVAWHTMRWTRYCLAMPNTGPIRKIPELIAYREQLYYYIQKHSLNTDMVMTLYFTDLLTPKIIEELARLPFPCAVKYYPPEQGATTGSGYGMPLGDGDAVLRAMSECDIPLLGHFESLRDSNGHDVPESRREREFILNRFPALRQKYPELRISIEHASTKQAVSAVKEDDSGKTVCTMTPHHLLFTEDDLRVRSWRNHLKCMPIVKTPDDRDSLLEFASSGDPRVILGTDTAAHPSAKKEVSFQDAACGAYVPHALSLYAMAFRGVGALDERFIKFACLNGPRWWGLSLPEKSVRIRIVSDTTHDIPEPDPIPNEGDVVIPLGWSAREDERLRIGHALESIGELSG